MDANSPRRKRTMVCREEVLRAVADYMSSEGCGCCQNVRAHELHTETLAKLLNVPPYEDGSGYNFHAFKSE